MTRRFGAVACFGILFLISISLSRVTLDRSPYPFPPLNATLSSPVAELSDFVGISMGFRKLTADIAWVQTLIYYGTHEVGVDSEVTENGGGNYPLFLAYCRRVGLIDPDFKYVYYYGGAVLGWNLNRLDEAEILLKEGIQYHPKEWRYQQFLAGLAYQKGHDVKNLIVFLQGFVGDPDCPNILRALLANIYKKQKLYREAIRLWMIVYNTGDPSFSGRAYKQIQELAPLAQKQQLNRP